MKSLAIWFDGFDGTRFVVSFRRRGGERYFHRPVGDNNRLGRLVERFYKAAYRVRPFLGGGVGVVIVPPKS